MGIIAHAAHGREPRAGGNSWASSPTRRTGGNRAQAATHGHHLATSRRPRAQHRQGQAQDGHVDTAHVRPDRGAQGAFPGRHHIRQHPTAGAGRGGAGLDLAQLAQGLRQGAPRAHAEGGHQHLRAAPASSAQPPRPLPHHAQVVHAKVHAPLPHASCWRNRCTTTGS